MARLDEAGLRFNITYAGVNLYLQLVEFENLHKGPSYLKHLSILCPTNLNHDEVSGCSQNPSSECCSKLAVGIKIWKEESSIHCAGSNCESEQPQLGRVISRLHNFHTECHTRVTVIVSHELEA